MRILWVKVGGLWPLTSGGRLRSFHLVRELARKHQVAILTTHSRRQEAEGLAAHLPCCRVVSIPHAPPKRDSKRFVLSLARSWFSPLPVDLWRWRVAALRDEAARRLEAGEADVCVADFLAAVPNLPARRRVPVVLFEHNVEHRIWQGLARVERRSLPRALLEVEWRKLRRFEASACRSSQVTIAVSQADREALANLAPGARVEAVTTGVDTEFFHPNGARERPLSLVFVGSMDWHPNEDAVLSFLDSTLPLIRCQLPAATLTVVGRNPSARVRAAASQAGVRVTGTVEDVRPYLDEAAASIVPLRAGGGTRLKILESLATGTPVVSTRLGAEGLPLVPGEHFLEADGPEAFAEAVVSLLRDPGRRATLAIAGRRLVVERHGWERVAGEFEERLREVVP